MTFPASCLFSFHSQRSKSGSFFFILYLLMTHSLRSRKMFENLFVNELLGPVFCPRTGNASHLLE